MRLINKTFSSDKKDKKSKKVKVLGTALIGSKLAKAYLGITNKEALSNNEKENEKLVRELKNKSKNLGYEITDSGIPKKTNIPSPEFNRFKNKIDLKGSKSPASLAHELGHAQYSNGKWKGNVIGKLAHKAYFGRINNGIVSPIASAALGYQTGREKARLEKEGKKDSFVSRNKHLIIPGIIATPVLVSEALASKKGYKMLKELGASKKLLDDAKKSYRKAYGTYGLHTASNSLLGEIVKEKSYEKEKKKLNKN